MTAQEMHIGLGWDRTLGAGSVAAKWMVFEGLAAGGDGGGGGEDGLKSPPAVDFSGGEEGGEEGEFCLGDEDIVDFVCLM